MSINHSAGCADANECFFTPRAEASGTLGYRSLILICALDHFLGAGRRDCRRFTRSDMRSALGDRTKKRAV